MGEVVKVRGLLNRETFEMIILSGGKYCYHLTSSFR